MSPLRAFHAADDAIGLLNMVSWRAPQMMRSGDVATPDDNQSDWRRFVSDADKKRFYELMRAGKSVDEVAAETNFSRQTVFQHTRSVRKAIGYDGRRRNNL